MQQEVCQIEIVDEMWSEYRAVNTTDNEINDKLLRDQPAAIRLAAII